MRSGLAQRALRAFAALLAQNLLSRVISYVSQIILAAILEPADFGLIGLAYTVSSIISLLATFSVDDVLLQRHRGFRFWAGTAFWLGFALSGFTAGLVVVAAPAMSRLYHAPQLTPILLIVAISIPIGALANVPDVMLRQRLRFQALTSYATCELLVQTGLTVLLAIRGFGAYSFVLPLPVIAAVRSITYWWLAWPVPSLTFQYKRWKQLFSRSFTNSVSRVLIGLIAQGDYLILGLFAAKSEVGAYYFAFRLSAQPIWLLAGNFNVVILPLLTNFKRNPLKQQEIVIKASSILSFIVIPLSFIGAAITEPMISLFFADKWQQAVPLIQLLSIGLSFDAVSWIAGSALVARGKFALTLKFLLVQMPIFFIVVTIGAIYAGAIGVASSVCLYYVISQPVYVYFVFRRFGMTARSVARLYVLPCLNAAIAVSLGLAAVRLSFLDKGPIGQILGTLIVGCGCYAVLTWRFAPDIWKEGRHRLLPSRYA